MERLRELLLDPERASAMRVAGRVDAAVLIALYDDPERGFVTLMTERHADLRKHAGEISFPGGRRDSGETLLQAALREAEEEVGLPRERVEVVGALAPSTTLVTRYRVYPFVGLIDAGHQWLPQETEVARVLEFSLADLRRRRRRRPLLERGVPVPTVSFELDGHLVWGATARITDQLLRRLRPLC